MGGRQQRSAQDTVLMLVHDIQCGWKAGEVTSALFLDVKGAFDNVSRIRLLETMQDMGLPSNLVSWVESFMSGRRIGLAFDGDREDMHAVETGIPQGSPCSPILFLIYIRPLFAEFQRHNLQIRSPSFMDDIELVARAKTHAAAIQQLEKASEVAFTWATNNAIAFDEVKTEFIHFSRAQTTPTASIRLPNNHTVLPSPHLRWLGVWLDSKLRFKHHVTTKLAAASRALSALIRLSNTERGLTLAATRQLYQACVLPIADFASEVWWTSFQQKHLANKLQLLQNTATRRILGAFRTTPVALLDVEACLPPAALRLDHNRRRYALRLLRLPPTHPVVSRCPEHFQIFNTTCSHCKLTTRMAQLVTTHRGCAHLPNTSSIQIRRHRRLTPEI